MVLAVGLFLTQFLPAIAAALLCLAGLLASEEMSSAFPDLGVEESSIHTSTHSCLRAWLRWKLLLIQQISVQIGKCSSEEGVVSLLVRGRQPGCE